MKIDTMPSKRVKAEALEHSIFTGTKFCFVNVDNQKDWSWDGQTEMIDWKDKAESVLFSQKELERFRPSDTVHSFIQRMREERKEEIARLKKEVRTAKTHWEHSRNPKWTCNPRQQIKDRIEFLQNNELYFIEIKFGNTK